jgi:hypothetical protein
MPATMKRTTLKDFICSGTYSLKWQKHSFGRDPNLYNNNKICTYAILRFFSLEQARKIFSSSKVFERVLQRAGKLDFKNSTKK